MMRRLAPAAALFMGLSVLMLRPAYPESIPLLVQDGSYVVPVTINGTMRLNFILDSGATDVAIPADVYGTLRRTGTISEADLLEPGEYVLADGSTSRAPRFRIRTLKVGDFELQNVLASVSPKEGSLLLGQSFLSRVPAWSVDNQRHLLVLNGVNPVPHHQIAPTPAAPQAAAPQAPADNTDEWNRLIEGAHRDYEAALAQQRKAEERWNVEQCVYGIKNGKDLTPEGAEICRRRREERQQEEREREKLIDEMESGTH